MTGDLTNIIVRCECDEDYNNIRALVKTAFSSAEHSYGDEHNLVDRIRKSKEYIPELSLVGVIDKKTVGHIMMSEIHIGHSPAVAIAPLSVHPDYQRTGIGKLLIKKAHKEARNLGYSCCVVLGAPEYYSKSGYVAASRFRIKAPFEVPDCCYMVHPLRDCADIPSGTVRYSAAFGI